GSAKVRLYTRHLSSKALRSGSGAASSQPSGPATASPPLWRSSAIPEVRSVAFAAAYPSLPASRHVSPSPLGLSPAPRPAPGRVGRAGGRVHPPRPANAGVVRDRPCVVVDSSCLPIHSPTQAAGHRRQRRRRPSARSLGKRTRGGTTRARGGAPAASHGVGQLRSEEHTSELQS